VRTTNVARLASTSTARSIVSKIASSFVGDMALKTHHMVAISAVSSPVMILITASRCFSSARLSTMSCMVPLPWCTAPGQR
jgi:hypothetical protein